jgi:hypothetical protein
MSQDFSDLGIHIGDFLDDLIKIRSEETKSFEIYNKYIKKNGSKSTPKQNPVSTSCDTTSSKTSASTNSKPASIPSVNSPKTKTQFSEKPSSPSNNLLDKLVMASEYSSSTPSQSLDKPIILKNKIIRCHIHCYDLRIGIKECRSEEEEQKLLQGLLEEFLDTMLSADKTIVIPQYYELDRSNPTFSDISSSFRIKKIF